MKDQLLDYLANASPDVQALNANLLPQPKRPLQEPKKKTPKTAVATNQDNRKVQDSGFKMFILDEPTAVNWYDPSWGVVDEWTGVEKRFAREYLLPLVLDGTYLWVMPQVAVYMVGQRYTFDFVALRRDGGADHYEIKGSIGREQNRGLGSEERASAKIRWATSFLREKPDSLHRVFWVAWRSMRGNPPQWHVREIHPDRKLHPIFTQED